MLRVLKNSQLYIVARKVRRYLSEQKLIHAMQDHSIRCGCRYVTYLCMAGLGNRLQAHIAALAYAKRSGRSLIVKWVRNNHFGATFEDLFKPSYPMSVNFYNYRIFKTSDLGNSVINNYLRTDKDLVVFDSLFAPFDIGELIHTMPDFREEVKSYLHPVNEIEDRINKIAINFPRPIVGVHIRRGDWCQIKDRRPVPLEEYVNVLRHTFKKWGSERTCFVASDAFQDELEPLFREFNCTINNNSHDPRGSLSEAKEALIDLILLSKCDLIVRTPGSSFCNVAAFLGKVPSILVS